MFLGVRRLVHAAGLLSSPLGLPWLQAQALKQGTVKKNLKIVFYFMIVRSIGK